MPEKSLKVIYVKPSLMGSGSITPGSQGKVLIYAKNPVTTKLLVDFPESKAIVPLGSVKIVEE